MFVKCPNCKRTDFKTTMKYQPDVVPNGSFVHCLLPYPIDWLCTSTTLSAEMTCPECCAQLVLNGRLTVVEESTTVNPPEETRVPTPDEPITTPFTSDGNPQIIEEDSKYPDDPKGSNDVTEEDLKMLAKINKSLVCDICGKECKNQLGLNSHKRSHKK
jgi:hypothetical protein